MLELQKPRKQGQWSESAVRVLQERYLRREGDKVVETLEEMCWRVARAIAEAELLFGKSEEEVLRLAEQFYNLMVEEIFMPNSPTLMNAGKQNGLQYSACYVLPVEDSMVGIFDAVKAAAIIHQSGGGTGFAFSHLRPKNALVRSTGGKASGPISFLRVFNAATDSVKQGGTRRGANMGILRVDHPNILEFIDCKRVLDEDNQKIYDAVAPHVSPEAAKLLKSKLVARQIANFNISVAATECFMETLRNDGEYKLIAPHTGEVVGKLRAREVFQRIVEAAWETGDPGMIFLDRINRSPANPTPELNEVGATNPCGEQPLYPNEACNLGSINLAKVVTKKNGEAEVDWMELERIVRLCVRFLDNVIEVNPYPLPEIDKSVKDNRRIGLGVMGWADMLFELFIPYDSEEALRLAEQVMKFIEETAHDESCNLADERGPFPNWSHSIYRNGRSRRNATVTTIAPTGTISIIAGCSSGIEPVFALAFSHIVGKRVLTFLNPVFERRMKELGFYSPELMEKVARQGALQSIQEVPEDVRRVFVTSHEIDPEWHVRMQAAFQKYTENAVSKTINLPHSATVEDVARAYMLAYELGCLGITVFRDGCKAEQVLHVGTLEETLSPQAADLVGGSVHRTPMRAVHDNQGEKDDGILKPRPPQLKGVTYRTETPLGTAFITVNESSDSGPFEVFINVGRGGSDTAAVSEAMGRLISLCLRLPSPLPPKERVREVVDQLAGIGGARPLGFGRQRVRSLPDAIAQVLAQHSGLIELGVQLPWNSNGEVLSEGNSKPGDLCPDCGQATLAREEGCNKCYSCGFSDC